LKPKFIFIGVKDSKSSLLFSVIIHCLVVGWERASSFGFSALGFSVGKKPNVLDRALAFFVCRTTVGV